MQEKKSKEFPTPMTNHIHAFLIPQFANAAVDHIELVAGEPYVLGRGDALGIADKNVSRRQATATIASTSDSTITLEVVC